MNFGRQFCLLGLGLFSITGCVTAGDQAVQSLARQQSATIESLKSEIVRLNQEIDGAERAREDLREAIPEFEKRLAGQFDRGDVQIVWDPRGLVVRIQDRALFDPDGIQFTPAGEEILENIAIVLTRYLFENRVSLEGHTDNRPIEDAGGITRWEYSIDRAVAVLHYFLQTKELSPDRFGVAGYSEYRPVASNDTQEGRDRNRRVEIVILPKKVSDESGI